jgi:hypothetical protein
MVVAPQVARPLSGGIALRRRLPGDPARASSLVAMIDYDGNSSRGHANPTRKGADQSR